MPNPRLGEQQLEILTFVTDNAPATARDVLERYGEPRGLARTTVITVLEKLRAKGYLTRTKERGVCAYTPAVSKADLMQEIVHGFVERTLGGSISPFVAYLANARDLSPAEVAELQRLAGELSSQKEEGDGC
jgi:predicted transcriptional regulator